MQRDTKTALPASAESAKSSEVDAGGEQLRSAGANYAIPSECPTVAPRLWENVPESQSFIACPCYDRGAIWAHSQIKDPVRVPGEGRYLLHGGILPYYYLVQGVAVCAYKLIVCF